MGTSRISLSFLTVTIVWVLGGVVHPGLAQTPPEELPAKVIHLQIYDPVEDDAQVARVEQTLRSIERGAGRKMVLVSIDSPGGCPDRCLAIAQAIDSAPDVTKIAFIDNGPYGGVFGPTAVIPFACDEVIIHPQAKLATCCPRRQPNLDKLRECPGKLPHEKLLKHWLDEPVEDQAKIRSLGTFVDSHGRPGRYFPLVVSPKAYIEFKQDDAPPDWTGVEKLHYRSRANGPVTLSADQVVAEGWGDQVAEIPWNRVKKLCGEYREIGTPVCSTLSEQLRKLELDIKRADDLRKDLDRYSGPASRKLAKARKLKGIYRQIESVYGRCPHLAAFTELSEDALSIRTNSLEDEIERLEEKKEEEAEKKREERERRQREKRTNNQENRERRR